MSRTSPDSLPRNRRQPDLQFIGVGQAEAQRLHQLRQQRGEQLYQENRAEIERRHREFLETLRDAGWVIVNAEDPKTLFDLGGEAVDTRSGFVEGDRVRMAKVLSPRGYDVVVATWAPPGQPLPDLPLEMQVVNVPPRVDQPPIPGEIFYKVGVDEGELFWLLALEEEEKAQRRRGT